MPSPFFILRNSLVIIDMSHVITINRRPNSTNLPDDIYTESKRRIGSVFTGTGDIIRGITFAQQKQLLPEVLGVSPEDPNFSRAAKEFYLNLTVDVPMGGIDLEIGTDSEGFPLNVMDYVRYKFAMAHPYVVENEESLNASKKHQYYISDVRRELAEAKVGLDQRKNAYKEYIKLTDSTDRMSQVLFVYGFRPDTMKAEEMELQLEELLEDNPEFFLDIVKDKNLEFVSLINQCLSKEVLRKLGNTILDGDVSLGESIEEAVIFLKDKKNSNVLTSIKAKLKAFT